MQAKYQAGAAEPSSRQRRILDQEELKQNQEDSINPLLGLVYALLAFAGIIVAVFGIANTLALSIYERDAGAGDAARGGYVAAPGAHG